MGNRFKGGIAPGAMPLLHRYLGNPVLSFIGRLFFHIKVGDLHCGLRGFRRERMIALNLRTMGMEFASEMVVRAALAGSKLTEVPTSLSKDGRSRPPHLRTWQDGWRHLSFLLVYGPTWLFFYPGLAMILIGAVTMGNPDCWGWFGSAQLVLISAPCWSPAPAVLSAFKVSVLPSSPGPTPPHEGLCRRRRSTRGFLNISRSNALL